MEQNRYACLFFDQLSLDSQLSSFGNFLSLCFAFSPPLQHLHVLNMTSLMLGSRSSTRQRSRRRVQVLIRINFILVWDTSLRYSWYWASTKISVSVIGVLVLYSLWSLLVFDSSLLNCFLLSVVDIYVAVSGYDFSHLAMLDACLHCLSRLFTFSFCYFTSF